jgi:L-threonylcarbamoyladenylate synthase
MPQTVIHVLDPNQLDAAVLAAAAEVLRAGGLVAFPTETVYGLGANALDETAVARVFDAKGRPPNNPVIVHVADESDLSSVVGNWPENAQRLARRFWPGPLTLVLPRGPAIPDIVTAGGPTVAVRMPAHPVARALIRAAGVPLAAPSANRSGELSPTFAEHVARGLAGRIEMILDGGPTQVGIESTVLDLSTSPPRLLRPGHISQTEIEAIIGPIARIESANHDESAALPSPGLLAKHYAPRTPTECLGGSAGRVRELLRKGERVGWLTFEGEMDGAVAAHMPRDPTAYAVRLYAELHRLDQTGLSRIVVEKPPETDDWLAVRDRLKRAAMG